MKGLSLKEWVIVIILALLTALEPLSIDLYLPAFINMSQAFGTTVAAVQISLTTFLAGFAIGQLFWGPLADRYGRKRPILISLSIFVVASVACIYVKSIEQLWVVRFLQAIGGCGGVVISRAVVTDYYESSKTLKIFTILALIMSIAPIVGPIIGNGIMAISNWKGIFGMLTILGTAMFLLTLFFLPETRHAKDRKPSGNVVRNYLSILNVKQFTVYALIAGVANGALMVYVGNAPSLMMEYGGLSSNGFSIVFAINAAGLMVASYLTSFLQRYLSTQKLVQYALGLMFGASLVLLGAMYAAANIYILLIVVFFYIFPIGILFPATTELAMKPFSDNSGAASALFGSIQLLIAFVCTLIANFISDGSLMSIGVAFLICGIMAFFFVFFAVNQPVVKPVSR